MLHLSRIFGAQCAPKLLMDQGILLGIALDRGEAGFYGAQEGGAQALGGLVVRVGLRNLGLGSDAGDHGPGRSFRSRTT
jgi:hypothetical protein